jgi:ankyrin repeat protein
MTALHEAALYGNHRVVEWLLDHGANVNAIYIEEGEVRTGPPILMAIESGSLETVELLVSHGASLKKSRDFSSVCKAAEEGHLDILQWLVKQGADMDEVVYDDIQSIMDLAVEKGHLDVVQWLVSQGFDVFKVDPYNERTLLHLAAQNGQIYMCMWLLSQGLDVNQIDTSGQTPLYLAVKARSLEVVRFLLLNDADPTISPEDEGTILDWVLERYSNLESIFSDMDDEMVKLIQEYIKK